MTLLNLTEVGFETAEIVVRPEKGKEGDENYRAAQSIRVRGVGLQDLQKLLRVHGPGIIKLAESTISAIKVDSDTAKPDIDPLDAGKIIVTALDHAPDLVADLIVIASDSPNSQKAFEIAARLPLPVQLKALQEIMRLTLEDHGGLGEFVETVVTMLGGLNGLLSRLTASEAGSPQSAGQSLS